MARDYNQQNPDGSWWHVTQDDNGNYSHTVIAPSGYQAAGIGGGGDQTYNTPNGPKTIAQIRQEMQTAGYNGATDDASLIAAYNATASGASGGGDASASMQKLLDAIASGDTAKADEAIREFNATLDQEKADAAEKQREFNSSSSTDISKTNAANALNAQEFNSTQAANQQDLYSRTAQALLNTASQLGGPADYLQFQQYKQGGKDLMTQLFGKDPNAAFTAPSGTNTPQTIDNLMEQLGFRQAPAAPTDVTAGTVSDTSGTPSSNTATGKYQTKNGTKSLDDMFNELKVAQWPAAFGSSRPSDDDIISAYKGTTGGDVTPVMDTGAQIAGGPGRHILAILQGGETVLPSPYKGANPRDQAAVSTLAQRTGLPLFDDGGYVPMYPTKQASIDAAFPKYPTTPDQGYAPRANPQPTSDQGSAPMYPKPPDQGSGPMLPRPSEQGYEPRANPPTWDQILAKTLPYQINPLQWDALGTTGQQLVLSAVKAAGWDTGDWLKELNAARPQGTAPNPQSVLWSYWNGSAGASPQGVY